jgi:hypothetical protein
LNLTQQFVELLLLGFQIIFELDVAGSLFEGWLGLKVVVGSIGGAERRVPVCGEGECLEVGSNFIKGLLQLNDLIFRL